MRAVAIPGDFMELLVPNKVQQVICTGNVGNRETVDWLKGLSDKFTMVKGEYEHVQPKSLYPLTPIEINRVLRYREDPTWAVQGRHRPRPPSNSLW